MKKPFIIITLLMLIISCAPRMIINVNNKKIPNNYFVLKTIESGMIIKIIAKEFSIVYEKGEKVVGVKELQFDNVNKVKSKTLVGCEIQCIIENPKNVKYNIWEEFVIQGVDDDFSTFVKKELYDGKLTSKTIIINIPKIKKGVVNTKVYIKDSSDYLILIFPKINVKYY